MPSILPDVSHSLTLQQVRATLVAAVLLALVFGSIQIVSDIQNERAILDREVARVVEASRESAALAAYTLDLILAERLVSGIVNDPVVSAIEIRDELGTVIANASRPTHGSGLTGLQVFLFSVQDSYRFDLGYDPASRVVGSMHVTPDAGPITDALLYRAAVTFGTGVLRNLLLGLTLLWLLQYTLTRPLRDLANRFEARQPKAELPPGHETDELGRIVQAYNRSLEQQLAAEQALRQVRKSEATNQLASGVAHDFNNVLNVVSGNVHLLKRGASEEHDRRRLEQIEKALGRAARLTRQLVKVSRSEPEATTRVQLNDVLKASEDWLRSAAGSQVDVRFDFGADMRLVEINVGDFEDALLNLAVNAVHAMNRSGELRISTADITVAARDEVSKSGVPPGNYARLDISDDGCGIEPELRERIFDPFFTTKPAEEGSGLGLSMVAGFAKRHGAFTVVESVPNAGTTFHLYFPAAGPSAGD